MSTKVMNIGGVCDNCGLPELAHSNGYCVDVPNARMEKQIAAWEAIVNSVRATYKRARRFERVMARRARYGTVSLQAAEDAARQRDLAMNEYRAAIRFADRTC